MNSRLSRFDCLMLGMLSVAACDSGSEKPAAPDDVVAAELAEPRKFVLDSLNHIYQVTREGDYFDLGEFEYCEKELLDGTEVVGPCLINEEEVCSVTRDVVSGVLGVFEEAEGTDTGELSCDENSCSYEIPEAFRLEVSVRRDSMVAAGFFGFVGELNFENNQVVHNFLLECGDEPRLIYTKAAAWHHGGDIYADYDCPSQLEFIEQACGQFFALVE